jgi:hypothetical protein
MWAWSLTNNTSGSSLIGNDAGANSNRSRIEARSVAGSMRTSANTNNLTRSTTVADSLGLHGWSRRSYASYDVFKDNTVADPAVALASSVISDGDVTVLRSFATYSNLRVAAACIGAGLTASEASALYSILLSYLQGVGAQ